VNGPDGYAHAYDETESRSADEIQRDINRRLASLDLRTDALEERLSPQRLFDELWRELRSEDGFLSISAAVKRHPVPVLLIATGLAWFLIERVTGRSTLGRRGEHPSSITGDGSPIGVRGPGPMAATGT
jgi:hypothetical protein